MLLQEQIVNDLKESMKVGNQLGTGVLRMVISAIRNKAMEKQPKKSAEGLTDAEVLQILNTEAKKRREASAAFIKGQRQDLADKEQQELVIIQKYLPAQLDVVVIEKAVSRIIKNNKFSDFGQAMKAVMNELRGQADAKIISEIVKKKL